MHRDFAPSRLFVLLLALALAAAPGCGDEDRGPLTDLDVAALLLFGAPTISGEGITDSETNCKPGEVEEDALVT
jgi:hypothetical protein